MCNKTSSHNSNYLRDGQIIRSYLLCGPWKKNAKGRYTLKERGKLFLKKVSEDIGYHPSVLYSISELLIGSKFRDEGVFWISNIIKNNSRLSKLELEKDAVFYMEHLIRSYIFENFQTVKTKSRIKQQILIVLNFLIGKGSAIAYRLRGNYIVDVLDNLHFSLVIPFFGLFLFHTYSVHPTTSREILVSLFSF